MFLSLAREHSVYSAKTKIEIQKSELWAIYRWVFDIKLPLSKSKF